MQELKFMASMTHDISESYSAQIHFLEVNCKSRQNDFFFTKKRKKKNNFIAPVYLYSYSLNIEHFFIVLKGHHKGTEPVV